MIGSALPADLSTAPELARGLPGGWIVLDWRVEYGDGRPGFRPLGENPVGYLLYTHHGLMSACLSRRDMQATATAAATLTVSEKADRYDSHFSYAGRYRIEDGVVIHSPDVALSPGMVRTEQRRHARLRGDRLLLLAHAPGSSRTDFIKWRRATAAVV